MRKINSVSSTPDYTFITLLVMLVIFGFVMLTSASSDIAQERFGNSYYYFTHQLLNGLLFGVIGFVVSMLVYYRFWERWSLVLLIISLVLMFLVFTPLGVKIKGGERWVDIGPFSFQPSELMKLTFFIYLAAWIGKNQARSKTIIGGFFPFLILVGSVMGMLLLQPATTTAVLLFAASLIMYFTAGAKIKFLAIAGLSAALVVSLLIYITPYRLERVKTFLNPGQDTLGSGYHIDQALLAIGSGGLTGVGFGKSTTKLHYLPEPIGDSIFAVIAEELGFIGAMILVIVFLALLWRGLLIAKKAPDAFSRLLVTGFICIIGLQVAVNIAAISGLIPLTGVPLPFISYGGTALTVFLTMAGMIVNISRYRR